MPEQNTTRIRDIQHIQAPINLTIEKDGVQFGFVLIPTGEDIQVEQRGDTTIVTTNPTAPGVGLTINFE